MLPSGAYNRLSTCTSWSAVTESRHLPWPSPRAPASAASPFSNCAAVTVTALAAGTGKETTPPGASAPLSSRPATVTSAGASPALTTRNRLTWLELLAGLKKTTSWARPAGAAVSCSVVRKPRAVRMYASTSASSAVESSKRQAPCPSPTLPLNPLRGSPISKSVELKWRVCPAASDSVTGPARAPASSTAWRVTSPATSERLTTRAKPSRKSRSAAERNNGTRWMAGIASSW